MTKHAFLILAALGIMVLIAAVPITVLAIPPTAPAEKTVQTKSNAVPQVVSEKPTKLEYTLPYPGILPDHPLFVLKRFRDWMLEMLIADPVRRGEFYILQADKRLNMAVFLKEQGKEKLVAESVALSLSFRKRAIEQFINAKSAGKPLPGHVLDRLEKSLAKHAEVLTDLGYTTEAGEAASFTARAAELK